MLNLDESVEIVYVEFHNLRGAIRRERHAAYHTSQINREYSPQTKFPVDT